MVITATNINKSLLGGSAETSAVSRRYANRTLCLNKRLPLCGQSRRTQPRHVLDTAALNAYVPNDVGPKSHNELTWNHVVSVFTFFGLLMTALVSLCCWSHFQINRRRLPMVVNDENMKRVRNGKYCRKRLCNNTQIGCYKGFCDTHYAEFKIQPGYVAGTSAKAELSAMVFSEDCRFPGCSKQGSSCYVNLCEDHWSIWTQQYGTADAESVLRQDPSKAEGMKAMGYFIGCGYARPDSTTALNKINIDVARKAFLEKFAKKEFAAIKENNSPIHNGEEILNMLDAARCDGKATMENNRDFREEMYGEERYMYDRRSKYSRRSERNRRSRHGRPRMDRAPVRSETDTDECTATIRTCSKRFTLLFSDVAAYDGLKEYLDVVNKHTGQ